MLHCTQLLVAQELGLVYSSPVLRLISSSTRIGSFLYKKEPGYKATCTLELALFPGPAQLCHFQHGKAAFCQTESDGKLGGAWEQGCSGVRLSFYQAVMLLLVSCEHRLVTS